MRVIICDTAEEATGLVVDRIAGALAARADAVLGLATGGTMERVYDRLIDRHRAGLSFARARSFNLDEYVGLPPEHPQSYHAYMAARLFDHVDFAPGNTFVPRGDIAPAEAAAEYEALLAEHGPVDLQLLGLGHNGHIGFNEPGSSLASRTREKTLARTTREANARFFREDERVPTSAVTMGIGTIMDARAVVVLALGAGKAEAVAAVVEGPVTAMCPGSALQFHRAATVIVDAEAAGGLRLAEHYRESEEIQAVRDSEETSGRTV